MDTVLFDLDGTLLPMDQDLFIKHYFNQLAKKCLPFGVKPETLVDAVWAGTKQIVQNDGSATNEERFWTSFEQSLGPVVEDLRPLLDSFYYNEFHLAKAGTQPNPQAAALVRSLKKQGHTLVLASNPVFPRHAHGARLSWIGLELDDFDWVTSYEHCHYAKPNPGYYREILEEIGKEPHQCLMIGNDVVEDGAAASLGIDLFLVTDNLINRGNEDLSGRQAGSFDDLYRWMETLPA